MKPFGLTSLVFSLSLLIGCGGSGGGPATDGPPAMPEGFSQAPPLPAWRTAEERAARQGHEVRQALRYARPPSGSVATPAEWHSAEGVIINVPLYGNTVEFFGRMIAGVVAAGAVPYLLVDSQYTADLITEEVLAPYGVGASEVSFVSMLTDAFWTRDYGPFHVYVDGEREIVDFLYYPNRTNDDAVPIRLGEIMDEEVYSAPLYTEGGNFMTDGRGTCWASTGVLDSNRLSEASAAAVYRSYLGCNTMTFVGPIPGEGTTHIDMFSKVLSDDTILVAYSSAALGATRDEIAALEQAALTYRSSPKPGGGAWSIVRIPMLFENDGGDWHQYRVYYAYTNSVIVNDTVLVPTYGFSTDSEALRIYRQAMPGYGVVGVPSREVIPMGGSVHCTTMQVPVAPQGFCGDGAVDGGEQCEPGMLGGATCQQLGYAGGDLDCTARCAFDTSGCT